jgi:hypothetical protein
MNCEQVRRKISDSLAAGIALLPPDLAGHKKTCAACRDFYEAQSELFRSLNTGLKTIAYAPVPPSLIPTVRSRIQDAAPRRAWIYTWLLAGAAVVLLCAVVLPLLHRAERRTPSPLVRSSDRRGDAQVTAGGIQATVRPNLSIAPRVTHVTHTRRTVLRDSSTSAHVEVIFDGEEARGLDHLVDSIRQKPALGRGFFQAAALPPDEMKPAPLIEIAELRVAPLADGQ